MCPDASLAPDLNALIDRYEERDELMALLERGRPALALLTGRRRVGKTYLLMNTWPADELFLFTAARTTPALNRQQLLADLAAWVGEPLSAADYPTWRTVFRLLTDVAQRRAMHVPPRPTVVVIDEFQYLADGEAGVAEVASELNAVWERKGAHARRGHTPLLMVLSGSAVSTMEALASGGAPLYGRFAWQHKLEPFTYWHAGELASFEALRDRALAYAVFGGTPRYLAAIRRSHSLARNVTDLLLSPRGEVRQLVETALEQEEGLRDAGRYRAVLRAVADGCTERNEIAQRTGLPNDQALREKLSTLIELGYLEQRRNIDAKGNEPVRYGIADAAFRFYYKFVAPNASMLERYPASLLWKTKVAPALDTYMGMAFERMVTQAYDRRALSLDLPAVQRWGRWEGQDRARASLEIDVVARLTDDRMMTGAIKWNRAPAAVDVHLDHLEMLRRAADAGRAWAHAALDISSPLLYVSASGFARGFRKKAEAGGRAVTCWSLDDMYAK
ncbi:MAG: hypothetical protein JWM95_4188 [Gemmatimonadetes bacterium]|nr:hypothetical protein [Gemmatimonadota bacterium]